MLSFLDLMFLGLFKQVSFGASMTKILQIYHFKVYTFFRSTPKDVKGQKEEKALINEKVKPRNQLTEKRPNKTRQDETR